MVWQLTIPKRNYSSSINSFTSLLLSDEVNELHVVYKI